MISIVQSVYKRNEFILETIKLNLMSLIKSGIDFTYIIFNDCGDEIIKDDIKEVSNDVKYIYSKINYGNKMCAGSYVGVIPYLEGEYVQISGQDDVMTSMFYEQVKYWFEKEKDLYFVTANGFKVSEDLSLQSILIHPEYYIEYRESLKQFKQWFGVTNNKVTRANNNMLASGTVYKRELHSLIGEPDLEYEGAADMEFWSRILFNEYKGTYIQNPCWYYRQSKYSAGSEIINGLINRGTKQNPGYQQFAIQRIKDKYTQLVKNDERFK